MSNPFDKEDLPGRAWWRGVWWGGSAVILAGFFIATALTEAVDWGAGDFLVAGALLGVGGAVMELSFRLLGSRLHRSLAVLGAVVLTAALWAALAIA